MKRYVKKYREGGPARFFQKKRTRSAAVLKPEVLEQAQERLNAGEAVAEMARALGINPDTLSKAIWAGRLSRPAKKNLEPRSPAKASEV
jgi:DNA invertase Pin-like site-specific DNA recombinase